MINVVDLFSGAGGLTFGFRYKIENNKFVKNKHFEILFANENDKYAAATFRKNFADIKLIEKDIRDLNQNEIRELLQGKEVDLIIGGPPCQSFSLVGKRIYDGKAKLYEEYIRVLKIIKPKMFLFENVVGILSMKETIYKLDRNNNISYTKTLSLTGKETQKPIIKKTGMKVIDKIKKELHSIDNDFGYDLHYAILNAVEFGVPQNRERVFLVGIRKDIKKQWKFPEPHTNKLITIQEAIGDLPKLEAGDEVCNYELEPITNYQKLMRRDSNLLTHHKTARYGDKIKTIIANIPQGEGKEYFNKLVNEEKIDRKYYITSGFPNTYGRLSEDKPSTTITNNLFVPSSLRCIHYEDNRALSPREGARIQSFPDWFDFCGSLVNVSKQIGNAVPPLLAMTIAERIKEFLEK